MHSRFSKPGAARHSTATDSRKAEFGLALPLILFLAGFLSYFSRSNAAFTCTAAIGALVAVRSGYLLILKCSAIRLTWFSGTGLLLGYALGTLNTIVGLAREGQTVATHFARPQEDLSLALAVVAWVSGLLFATGAAVEKGLVFRPKRLRRTDIGFVILALLFVLTAVATGSIGYMGASVSDDKHVSIMGELAGLLSPIVPALTILLKDRVRFLRNGLALSALLLIELAPLVPQGRRVMIYSVVLAVLAFHFRGNRWRLPMLQKIALISVCLGGLYCANVLFYAMRHIANQSDAASRAGAPALDLSAMTSRALDFIKTGRDSQFDQQLAENLRDRTFVLIYLAEVISKAQTHEPLHGQDLAFCFKMAIPSAFYPNKSEVLAVGMEENFTNPRLGLTMGVDEANSMLTTGAADWGIAGCFLYPVVLCLVLSFAARIASRKSSEVVGNLVVLSFVYSLFQTEMTITLLFVLCRGLLIVSTGWVPVNLVLTWLTPLGRSGARDEPLALRAVERTQPVRPLLGSSRRQEF